MSESFRHDLKGVKSATVLSDLVLAPTSETVQFMLMSSFYLPTDILQSDKVKVLPVKVITGEQFARDYYQHPGVCCDVIPAILCKARFVGVSVRWLNSHASVPYTVCKLWYGQAPKGAK